MLNQQAKVRELARKQKLTLGIEKKYKEIAKNFIKFCYSTNFKWYY